MSASVDAETVRRGVDAFNRGDIDGMLEVMHPDVTLVPVRALLEGGEYHGHDGVRRYFSDMEEDWASRRIEIDEIRDLDDGVLVLGTFALTGRSGNEVRYPLAWHSQYRDGKLWRMQAYSDRDAALRAHA